MSAIASAGAVAWVAPEILTAKPAGGATLSGPTLLTGGSPPNPNPNPTGTGTAPDGPSPGADPATTPDPAVATGASGGTTAGRVVDGTRGQSGHDSADLAGIHGPRHPA